jgi:uncharacterized protein YbaP (TraB family)
VSRFRAAVVSFRPEGRAFGAALAFVLAACCLARVDLPLLAGAAVAEAGERPLFLWTARSDSTTIHLLGSVHVGSEEFYPLAPAIEEAFESADVLAVELDMSDSKVALESGYLLMQKASLPEGVTLRNRISAETWQALQAYLRERRLSPATYDRLRPGAVAMFLALSEMQRLGFDPRLGVDLHFLERARARGLRIESLETVSEQVEALMSGDLLTDELLLQESLAQTDSLGAIFDGMVAAWQRGDVAAIEALITEQMLEDPRLLAFHDRVLVDRNRRLAERIASRPRAGETWFVVVGAAHLVGETGLPTLLAERGFEVTQVHGEPAGTGAR